MKQYLNVIDRSECKITGVSEIVNYSKKEILIGFTDDSLLMIRGKNMKIDSFSGDYIYITGKFDSFTYSM